MSLHSDGSFRYRRPAGPASVDTFTYVVSDSGGAVGNSATVFIGA